MNDKIFPRFFNASDLGKTFREVSVDVIRTESQDIVNRWYHSAKDADLFVWMDSQQNIIKQQLSFYGQVIEWNVIEGVRTGCVLETEDPVFADKRRRSDIIQFDQKPQASSLSQALELLRNITVLKDDERKLLMNNFSSSQQTAHTMDPEEFVRRFGPALRRPSADQPGIFNRLRRWLKKF